MRVGPLWHSGCDVYHAYVHSMHTFTYIEKGYCIATVTDTTIRYNQWAGKSSFTALYYKDVTGVIVNSASAWYT